MRTELALTGFACLFLAGCGSQPATPLDPDLARFVAEKEAQATRLANAQPNRVPAKTWGFFDAVAANDWSAATNRFQSLVMLSGRSGTAPRRSVFSQLVERLGKVLGQNWGPKPSGLRSEVWAPIMETFGTYELAHEWNAKWLRRYADEIIGAVPEGSVYFGGTDAGRFAVTAFSESHVNGRPFLTLTQNALADQTYLVYLRSMYGGLLVVPTPQDSQTAFQQYLNDAQERLRANQLKPGENVQVSGGRVSVSGQGAVMEINGLLVKTIIEKNPGREFYLEESFPIDWMRAHLEPHGPILRLHPQPLDTLSDAVVARDREYWGRFLDETLGIDLGEMQDVQQLCDLIEQVHAHPESTVLKGDRSFVEDSRARQEFSALRCAIARLYAWRAQEAADPAERARMDREAHRAFRQAFALWPARPSSGGSAELTPAAQFAGFLRERQRPEEADAVTELSERLTNTGKPESSSVGQ